MKESNLLGFVCKVDYGGDDGYCEMQIKTNKRDKKMNKISLLEDLFCIILGLSFIASVVLIEWALFHSNSFVWLGIFNLALSSLVICCYVEYKEDN